MVHFCNCDDDRTVIGNGLPTFTMGWNNSFNFWKVGREYILLEAPLDMIL